MLPNQEVLGFFSDDPMFDSVSDESSKIPNHCRGVFKKAGNFFNLFLTHSLMLPNQEVLGFKSFFSSLSPKKPIRVSIPVMIGPIPENDSIPSPNCFRPSMILPPLKAS